MKTLLIGDVHGQVNKYKEILDKEKPDISIQLGDFGFGKHHQWHRTNVDGKVHKVLLGNHDDPAALKQVHTLKNFDSYYLGKRFFYVRGAYSIDKAYRTEGIDWWPEEELSYVQLQDAIDAYEHFKPEIVLTHDCPDAIRREFFNIHDSSKTSAALQAMFNIHQPKQWFFAHHHKSVQKEVEGTQFRCLAELEYCWL